MGAPLIPTPLLTYFSVVCNTSGDDKLLFFIKKTFLEA